MIKRFFMLINENKLRGLIRQVIKEMAHSFGGIHNIDDTGIKNPKYNVTSDQSTMGQYGANERNLFPSKNYPDVFKKRMDWHLKHYPGCDIHTFMFPSNFAISDFFDDHLLVRPETSRISDLIVQNETLDRTIDITDRLDDMIYELSQELDENNPSVRKLFEVLRDSKQLASNNKNGVLIYLGAHTEGMGHTPSPFIILHQYIDSDVFSSSEAANDMQTLLSRVKTFNKESNPPRYISGSSPGFFEGAAQKISDDTDAIWNLILQSAGWLDPKVEIPEDPKGIPLKGKFLEKNPKNIRLGLSGNERTEIVRRCLAPQYKNDNELIGNMVSLGFVELLCDLLNEFWDSFRGRVMLTFSTRL